MKRKIKKGGKGPFEHFDLTIWADDILFHFMQPDGINQHMFKSIQRLNVW